MDSALIEQLRASARALDEGDTGPLVALFDPDLDWRGVAHGFLWWKHAPS